MRPFFENEIEKARQTASEIECRVRVVATVRVLLQQVAYGLIEWISSRRPDEDLQPDQKVISSLYAPTDGTLVDSIEILIVCCEQLGWGGVSRVLLAPVLETAPAHILCGNHPENVGGLLRALVELRNDGAEGHGLIGGYKPDAETDALTLIVNALNPITPYRVAGASDLYVGADQCRTKLSFLRSIDGKPTLIRKIRQLASDRVRVNGQLLTSDGVRQELNFDASNPFFGLTGRSLPRLTIWENEWCPSCYLPERTTDSFTGRKIQLRDLLDWFDDVDARACLVFGDGGLGKTTLLLEFLHRVLDEEVDTSWKPKIIIFYTAKRWQWGIDGLEPIGAGRPHLLDLLCHMHVLLFGKFPSHDFYRLDLAQASMVLQQRILSDISIKKKDILIVIDNAETLIQTDAERAILGRELKDIMRRLGRVILTSRRREIIEAEPVAVDPLTEEEAVKFLQDSGSKLKIKLLERAETSELQGVVQDLERRPIVLEALVKALTDPSVRKLESAVGRVKAMLGKDLGNFLFADAWARLKPNVRRLLLLMTSVSDVHDAQSLRICAKIIGVSPQEAEQSLEESGGIASIVHVDGALQVSFSKNFLEYAKNASASSASMRPTSSEISSARSQYSTFIRNAQKFTGDRIVQAFRTPQAKAAHRARQEGKVGECAKLYEQAVMTDSTNGWLFDRYAYFLFHDIRDNSAALHQAKRAVELLPEEGEPWFTRGLIEARLGDLRACELSLRRAEALGIEPERCAIQRCWAYLKARPVQIALAEKELNRLKTLIPKRGGSVRLLQEIERIEARLIYLRGRLR